MVLDFVPPFVQVVVQYQLALLNRNKFQAFEQTFVLVARVSDLGEALRDSVSRDLFPSPGLSNDIARDAVKISCTLSDVSLSDVRQSIDDSIDSQVCQIFGVTKAPGNKNSY